MAADLAEAIRKTRRYPIEQTCRIADRIPTEEEFLIVQRLVLRDSSAAITDDDLAEILPSCPNLLSIVLTGVADASDRSLVILASTAVQLQGIDLSGCKDVSDVGILELMSKAPRPFRWIKINGVHSLTDPSIAAIARSCPELTELGLQDLPLITAVSLRDVWTYSRQLEVLRLAYCRHLTDKAFPADLELGDETPPVPSVQHAEHDSLESDRQKPLPPRPTTWLEYLPPLILPHRAEHLRVLDLESCADLTDEAIAGIVSHAPRIHALVLSGCVSLTDKAIESLYKLGNNLELLKVARLTKITDRAIIGLARSCLKLESIDLAFCTDLTDMSVFELACLKNLRRLGLVRVHRLTDQSVFFLAEHNVSLERLYLSYCDRISVSAIHIMLRRLSRLQYLNVIGVPDFRQAGLHRFSDPAPVEYDANRRAAYLVFSGENVHQLREFVDAEETRKRDAEAKGILLYRTWPDIVV